MFAYVTNQNSNDISIFTILPSGQLSTGAGSMPAGSAPVAVAVDPTGKFVCVANSGSSNVSVYSIADPERGTLSEIVGSPF
jgi:6-phosphogluconolactonase (cycloisomerase 2 family)